MKPDLPRIDLAQLPTPLQPLPRLSALLGVELVVKRDDQTGLALGGNKTRKLELLLGAARTAQADTLVTVGAPQSNHCRQTAAAAAAAGLRCVLVLGGESQPLATGNLLLDRLLGAEVIWAGDRSREAVVEEVCAREQAAGRRPYLIPYGGSNPIGAAAYAAAMHELLEQDAGFDRIVFASSSGGTHAGLLLGARQQGFRGLLHAISVDRPAAELAALVAELASRTAEMLGDSERFAPAQVFVDDRFLGGGYAVMGEPEREAIDLFARNEAILLDPVYTGRAAAGLLALARSAELRAGERVLFWHTGGAPALWAYARELT